MRRLMFWFSRHPTPTLILLAGISVAALFPAQRLRITSSIEGLMTKDDPERIYYNETRGMFGSEIRALVYVEDPELFTPKKLRALQDLTFALEQIPGVCVADSLYTVTDFSRADGALDVHALMDWPPETMEEADRVKRRTLAQPVLRGLLASKDGTATLINMRLSVGEGNQDELHLLSKRIERVVQQFAPQFKTLFQHGRPYVCEREVTYIKHDQMLLIPLSMGALLLMLLVVLGSLKGALLPILTSGISILWTLGFMGLFDFPVTELSFMIPALLIVIGSTEDIHLLAEFKAGRRDRKSRPLAVELMIRKVAVAVFFTALTTFCGFFSITASPMPILRQFGIVAAFGMLVNPLVTISLIPVCLTLMPDHTRRSRRQKEHTGVERVLLRLLVTALDHRRIILAAACLPCIVFGIYGAMNVKADNNIVGFFREDSPIIQRAELLHEKLSGTETFYIRLDGSGPGAFKQPANLAYAMQLQRHLEEAGWIDRSISLTDYLEHIHRVFSGGEDPLPKTAGSVAEYLLFLHRGEIEPYVTSDCASLNIIVQHSVSSSRELMPKIAELRRYIRHTSPPGLRVGVTGEMLLVNQAVRSIIRGQLRGILVIAFVSAALLSLLFRSVRIGLMGLIPNLLPLGVQFGTMAALDIPLNTGTSMAAAISIGLAVDDTIHLMLRFYRHNQMLDQKSAVVESISHLLRPVLATTISLTLGFMVLRFSRFMPIRDFGLLAAVVMVTALISDLLVTPALLLSAAGRPPARYNKLLKKKDSHDNTP